MKKYSCNSWTEATKEFANLLMQLPENKPIALLPIVKNMLGEKQEWAKDILKQFERFGFIQIETINKNFSESNFIILKNNLNEYGIY